MLSRVAVDARAGWQEFLTHHNAGRVCALVAAAISACPFSLLFGKRLSKIKLRTSMVTTFLSTWSRCATTCVVLSILDGLGLLIAVRMDRGAVSYTHLRAHETP